MDLPARGIEMSIADTGVLSARIGDAVDGAIRIDREVEQDLGGFPHWPLIIASPHCQVIANAIARYFARPTSSMPSRMSPFSSSTTLPFSRPSTTFRSNFMTAPFG